MGGDGTTDIDPLCEEKAQKLLAELAKIIHEWLKMDELKEELKTQKYVEN
jgi:hypothetical protein